MALLAPGGVALAKYDDLSVFDEDVHIVFGEESNTVKMRDLDLRLSKMCLTFAWVETSFAKGIMACLVVSIVLLLAT